MSHHIQIVTSAFRPGFRAGGLVQATANLIDALKHELRFSVITSGWDLGETSPYPDVPLDRYSDYAGIPTLYLNRGRAGLMKLVQVLHDQPVDVRYLNGLFDPQFNLLPLLVPPARHSQPRVVVAIHGMLGPGALEQKRHKKALFLRTAQLLKLYRHVRFHATSHDEARYVRAHFGPDAEVLVAPNLAGPPRTLATAPPQAPATKTPGHARFLFLSRISPKKNLELALRALTALEPSPHVTLDIVGPEEDPAYVAQLKTLIPERWRSNIRFQGPIPHRDVARVMREHHFFVLPTRDENYGYAIVEALQQGLPLLLSEHTPWRKLQEQKVGWDLPLDTTRWTTVMRDCVAMSPTDFARMATAARTLGQGSAQSPEQLSALRQLLQP